MRAALLPILLAIGACSAPEASQPAASANIFVGELSMLDGVAVNDSQLKVGLFSKSGDFDAPDQYRISGGCFDRGFLDKADGRFWSGSAPAKNAGIEIASPARRGEAHCPPEDAARYVRLIEIMYEGPTLEFDRASATFTAPTKGTAKFRLGHVYPE
ncbi:hypothetical protein D3C86_1646460 [compost metagenome]